MQPLTHKQEKWMTDVTYEFVILLDITNSDAQGIMEAAHEKVNEAWMSDLSPKEAAKFLERETLKPVSKPVSGGTYYLPLTK